MGSHVARGPKHAPHAPVRTTQGTHGVNGRLGSSPQVWDWALVDFDKGHNIEETIWFPLQVGIEEFFKAWVLLKDSQQHFRLRNPSASSASSSSKNIPGRSKHRSNMRA